MGLKTGLLILRGIVASPTEFGNLVHALQKQVAEGPIVDDELLGMEDVEAAYPPSEIDVNAKEEPKRMKRWLP